MSDFKQIGYPAYSAEGLTGFVDQAEFKGPAVIVSSIGEKCGKCFYAEGEFTTLANVQVVFPNTDAIDPYYLWSLVNDARFWPRAQTAQPFIRPSDIKKSWIPIPTDSEQIAISELLRLTDKALDAARAELLAAQRLKTALMQQLFTKGIPGRHKDFKETKIGKVPGEWDILRGRQCIEIKGLYSPVPYDAGEEGDCHYLKVSDFNLSGNEKIIRTSQTKFWRNKQNESRLYPPGLIAIAKRGEALKHNRVRFTGAFSMIDPNIMLLDAIEGVTFNQYLYHYLLYRGMARFCEDAGIPQLNNKDIYPRWFPMPKMDEQMKIVEILEAADSYIFSVSNKVSALERLKKSLLQNLLTGKVRVNREAQV